MRDFDFGTERAGDQHSGVRSAFKHISVQIKTRLIASCGTYQRKRGSSIAGACLNNNTVCVELSAVPGLSALCSFDHGQCHTILVASTGVEMLQLDKNICVDAGSDFIQL